MQIIQDYMDGCFLLQGQSCLSQLTFFDSQKISTIKNDLCLVPWMSLEWLFKVTRSNEGMVSKCHSILLFQF
uniref:Uncharacterized protein n=1 Tax=Anguilla anguilla TaxID=7936 RepID=A0A0E9X870_ANGAN